MATTNGENGKSRRGDDMNGQRKPDVPRTLAQAAIASFVFELGQYAVRLKRMGFNKPMIESLLCVRASKWMHRLPGVRK